jgi:hypothetical protein
LARVEIRLEMAKISQFYRSRRSRPKHLQYKCNIILVSNNKQTSTKDGVFITSPEMQRAKKGNEPKLISGCVTSRVS